MNTYKNVSKNPIIVAGLGVIEPGKTVETELLLDNPHLTLEKATKKSNKEE